MSVSMSMPDQGGGDPEGTEDSSADPCSNDEEVCEDESGEISCASIASGGCPCLGGLSKCFADAAQGIPGVCLSLCCEEQACTDMEGSIALCVMWNETCPGFGSPPEETTSNEETESNDIPDLTPNDTVPSTPDDPPSVSIGTSSVASPVTPVVSTKKKPQVASSRTYLRGEAQDQVETGKSNRDSCLQIFLRANTR
jgi:hypothetical protein